MKFTQREIEVIKFCSQGLKDEEIAQQMNVTVSGVRKFITNMFVKTGTVNKPHLISWAFRNGVL